MTDPAQDAYEAAYPVANQIREAKSNRARALQLLQLSDAALLDHHVEIELACIQCGFAAGQAFLVYRIAALCRTRDVHGILPDHIALELEAWRLTMSRIAAGVAGVIAPDAGIPYAPTGDGSDGQ